MRKISIVAPCRNEQAHIGSFLEDVIAQKLPAGVEMEMLIAEGASSDGTRGILAGYANRYPWIRVIENPRKIVSSGLNLAIGLATGDTIVRLDIHARYAPDYVAECLKVLEETGADNVGGPARTEAHTYMQRAISAAYHSRFACGGARFHDAEYEGYVDTVTFGCWRKAAFDKFGLFDEEQIRNQDDEHNLRMTLAGGRIFQSPRIQCWYAPRTSLRALFRQYQQYGFWKVRLIRKHGRPASFRHIIPAGFVGTIAMLAVAAPFSRAAGTVLALLAGLYMLSAVAASMRICAARGIRLFPVMPLVLATYHVSYGIGFLSGVCQGLGTSLGRGAMRYLRS